MHRLFSLVLLLAFFPLTALSDAKQVASDDTQKRYERKVVLGFQEIAFEQNNLDVPIKFCKRRKEGTTCSWWNIRVNFPLDETQRLKAGKTFYDWTITSRFDKVLVESGKMTLYTRKSVQESPLGSFPVFRPGIVSNIEFRANLEQYLNTEVALMFKKLMMDASKQRYKELPEKEQATFITTKAKELGMSANVIRKLMNSAFVFAAHVDRINASGTLTQYYTKTLDGRSIPQWEIKFDIPMAVSLYIYRFDPEKDQFVLYKVWQAFSGAGTGAFDTRTMTFLPNAAQVTEAFKETYQTALKAAAINANYKMKEDDNFAIFVPITGFDHRRITVPVGIAEDIRVDHPFTVREKVDGKWKVKGYARARDVGKNCMDDTVETRMQLVKGRAEQADLLREYPWTGLFFQLGLGSNTLSLSGKSGWKDYGDMFAAPALDLAAALDLGYAANSKALSEFYISFYAGGSFAINSITNYGQPLNYFGGLGFDKRFYVGAGGFFIGIGGRVGYMGGVSVTADDDYSLSYGTISLTPRMQLGWSFTPSFELIVNAGWNLAFLVHGTIEQPSTADIDTTDAYETFTHGLNAGITFSFHLPIVGAMSKMYSKPSKECDALKKNNAQKQEKGE